MRRYFITQHPTFGSYAKPIRSKIETSPYFYWWLALKAHKKNAVAEVKKLILQYNLTKGDIRGKALKQLEL